MCGRRGALRQCGSLDEGTYNEAIVVGINGTVLDDAGGVADAGMQGLLHFQKKNNRIPEVNFEKIRPMTGLCLTLKNVDGLFRF